MRSPILILSLLLLISAPLLADQRAVIIVPVADLVGSPLDTRIPELGTSIIDRYLKLPYSDAITNKTSTCPRIHQLLFNEQVTVIGMYEFQACISIPQLFYITHANTTPQNVYWTLKRNLTLLSQLEPKEAAHNLPTPLDFSKPTATKTDAHTISLKKPWKSERNILFSAGTRFIYDPKKNSKTEYGVAILNPKTKKFNFEHIPMNLCFEIVPGDHRTQIENFLHILREWAHHETGIIPYVWGGCSYCTRINENNFEQKSFDHPHFKTLISYTRPNAQAPTKCGFDCAGLIARAAHMVGMPYFYKNTLTLARFLDELQPHETLEEGDLIWIPGHVMVVSSLRDGLLIEARSYMHGYGIVHEIPLSTEFKGMNTYTCLVNAGKNKEPLIRLDAAGNEVEKIRKFKLLKLASIWRKKGL